MVTVFRHHLPVVSIAQLAVEAMLLWVAAGVAVFLYPGAGHAVPAAALDDATVFAATVLCANVAVGSYRRDLPAPFAAIVFRTLAALAVAVPFVYLLLPRTAHGFTVAAMAASVGLAFAGLVAVESTMRRACRAGMWRRGILIVGTGADAMDVDESLAASHYLRDRVVGFFPAGQNEDVVVDRTRLVQGTARLPEVVARLGVREVIVATREQRGGGLPLEDLLDCRLRGIVVTEFATFVERVRGRVPLASLKASWLIYGSGFAQGLARRAGKRAIDLLATMAMLPAAVPVMLLAAVAIRVESPGPALYRQRRVGEGGRVFDMLKLRSMRQDAEGDGVARWAKLSDARITRVGRLLRKTRIDELPQLLNILRGEMSLVGPRPERPAFVGALGRQLPFYALRHTVRPGLTGWAQVRCGYAASIADARDKLEFDLYYVKNHSLFLDALILLETLRVVVLREGAR